VGIHFKKRRGTAGDEVPKNKIVQVIRSQDRTKLLIGRTLASGPEKLGGQKKRQDIFERTNKNSRWRGGRGIMLGLERRNGSVIKRVVSTGDNTRLQNGKRHIDKKQNIINIGNLSRVEGRGKRWNTGIRLNSWGYVRNWKKK